MTTAAATGRQEVSVDELRGRLVDAFNGTGMPAEEGQAAAEVCLEAELLGKTSHGIRLAGNISREYIQGAARRSEVTFTSETPVSAAIDAGFHCSIWAHRTAASLAAAKAATYGIAIVSVKNAGVSGALGIHAEAIADKGLVALTMNAAPSVVVAPGSATPLLGTNPIAIAAPRHGQLPVVLDMSTAAIAFNKVMAALQAGEQLPPDVAVDATASHTRDPRAALDETGRGRLLPFGGHRGFGLALMIELLVGAGVGGLTAQDKRATLVDPAFFPGIYIAWKPEAVGDAHGFDAGISHLLADLSRDGIRIPGERSQARRATARERGVVEVATESLALLERLAAGQPA